MQSGQKRPEKARKAEAAFLLRKVDCSVNSHTLGWEGGAALSGLGPLLSPCWFLLICLFFPLPHSLPSLTLVFHFPPLPPASSSTLYLSFNPSFFPPSLPLFFPHTGPSISTLSPRRLPALLLACKHLALLPRKLPGVLVSS